MSNLSILAFFHAASSTWSYLIADSSSGRAAVIDTALDFDVPSGRIRTTSAQAIDDELRRREWALEWILETHAHADHLSAAAFFKQRHPQARTAIGRGITQVQATFKPRLDLEPAFATDGSQFDVLLDDGQRLSLGAHSIEVIAVPGHTSDSMAYLVEDALFVGDTVFAPDTGTARCDFPGGDAAQLHASIQRMYALPDDTRVFLCHDYPPPEREAMAQTSIGAQKSGNRHLRADTPLDDFLQMRRSRDATLAVPVLLYPAVQINIRAGQLPPTDARGQRFLKSPVSWDENG